MYDDESDDEGEDVVQGMPMAQFRVADDPATRAAQNADHFTRSQWRSMLADGSRNNRVWNSCVYVDARYVGCVVWISSGSGNGGGDDPHGEDPPPGEPCDPIDPTPPTPDPDRVRVTGSVVIDPAVRGLTGLETRVWVSGDATRSFSWTQTGSPGLTAECETIPAPTRTFSVRVEEWTITVDGPHGAWRWTTTAQGSGGPAAGTFVPDHTGDHVLGLTARVEGDVSLTAPVSQRDYDVIEVRSRLTP